MRYEMKKQTLFISIAILLFALISCADTAPIKDTDTTDEVTTGETTETETETEIPEDSETEDDTTAAVPDTEDTSPAPESAYLANGGGEFVYDPDKHIIRIPEHETKYVYSAKDTSDKLTSLVDAYLADGSGYDELYATVFFQFVCAANLYREITYGGLTPYYYNSEADRYAYEPMILGSRDYYWMARYGEADTWLEYMYLVCGIFDEDLASLLLSDYYVLKYNDLVFSRNCTQAVNRGLRDPEFSLEVKEDMIILKSVRLEYDYLGDNTELTGNTHTDYYILKKTPDTNLWLWVYMGDGYNDLTEE